VAVTDERGRPMAAGGLGGWLERAAPGRARGRVAVAIVADRTMRRLNRAYRGIDRVTDVLSFPGSDTARRHRDVTPALGDIAIARGRAARQARRFGHSQATEWRILALHGLLHLLGYDHDTDRGEMSRMEERLRTRAGLPAGLMARPVRAAASR
jgi:probable rRNA maturation factor